MPGPWYSARIADRSPPVVQHGCDRPREPHRDQVNGKTTADYTDDNRLFSSGHIALQQLDPSTVAEFRKIEIKELNGNR